MSITHVAMDGHLLFFSRTSFASLKRLVWCSKIGTSAVSNLYFYSFVENMLSFLSRFSWTFLCPCIEVRIRTYKDSGAIIMLKGCKKFHIVFKLKLNFTFLSNEEL